MLMIANFQSSKRFRIQGEVDLERRVFAHLEALAALYIDKVGTAQQLSVLVECCNPGKGWRISREDESCLESAAVHNVLGL